MAKQEQVQKQKSQTRTEDTHVEESNADVSNAELAESTDAALANIDDVLGDQEDQEILDELDELMGTEEEAAQLVAQYIQQGGE